MEFRGWIYGVATGFGVFSDTRRLGLLNWVFIGWVGQALLAEALVQLFH